MGILEILGVLQTSSPPPRRRLAAVPLPPQVLLQVLELELAHGDEADVGVCCSYENLRVSENLNCVLYKERTDTARPKQP